MQSLIKATNYLRFQEVKKPDQSSKRRERVRRKNTQVREKVEQSRNIVFFQHK